MAKFDIFDSIFGGSSPTPDETSKKALTDAVALAGQSTAQPDTGVDPAAERLLQRMVGERAGVRDVFSDVHPTREAKEAWQKLSSELRQSLATRLREDLGTVNADDPDSIVKALQKRVSRGTAIQKYGTTISVISGVQHQERIVGGSVTNGQLFYYLGGLDVRDFLRLWNNTVDGGISSAKNPRTIQLFRSRIAARLNSGDTLGSLVVPTIVPLSPAPSAAPLPSAPAA